MDILQDSGEEIFVKKNGRMLSVVLFLNALALVVTIILNFLGLPILKYHYLLHVIITMLAILSFEIPEIFSVILTFLFVEGQGRILWEYQDWARIIFDIVILIGVVKIFIRNKKIISIKNIPTTLTVLILFHFLWYLVEFFNPNSSSFMPAIFGLKIYIYPFFFFFAVSQLDFNVGSLKFDRTITFLVFILILELSLNFYQYQQKEISLTSISQYYLKIFKDDAFIGNRFRPFATSFIPGALSMFIYLTAGLLFLWQTKIKGNIVKLILIAASIHALVICQIRSSLIKYLLLIILIFFGKLIYERFRSKKSIASFFFCLLLLLGTQVIDNISFNDKEADVAVSRVLTLANPTKLKFTRLNLDEFGDSLYSKITAFPIGLGPGSSGAAAASGPSRELFDKKINAAFLWTGDNLFISLILDFGIGAFFYMAIILYIPIYFFSYLSIFYRRRRTDPFQILLVCFCSITVIVIGNWGFLGLPYNPESFMFWFFSALGFNTIFKFKHLSSHSHHETHASTSPAKE